MSVFPFRIFLEYDDEPLRHYTPNDNNRTDGTPPPRFFMYAAISAVVFIAWVMFAVKARNAIFVSLNQNVSLLCQPQQKNGIVLMTIKKLFVC